MAEELLNINDSERFIQPEEAYENFIPDSLFPVDPKGGEWEIPLLDDTMQAVDASIPFICYGEQKRTYNMQGNGTLHFFTDDYRYSDIYNHPEKILRHHPRNIIEPNFSMYLDMAPALVLGPIYKKRAISRMMQDRGIRVFVDLNVAQKHAKLNLIGVPDGWRAFATRGYSDRLPGLEFEYRIAEHCAAYGGRKPLFVVYGGGSKCRDFCREVGAIYVTPNIVLKNKEQAWQKLIDDNIIAFTDADFSKAALEEGKTNVRLNQAEDYRNNLIEN